jgi:Rieske Fe-S protein
MTAPLTRRSFVTGGCIAVAGGIVGFAYARSTSLTKSTTAHVSYGPTASGSAVIAVTAVPVGGGVIVDRLGIVVTQPTAGAIHAFSSKCTHLGCTVSEVHNGVISCPCHGSEFNDSTGAVVHGPATRPLPTVNVVVRNGSVYEG